MQMAAHVRRRALASLIPPERLPLSEWIEGNVVLPQGTTAVPGPMRLYPYQRGLADSIGDPAVERVTVVKAARVGFTSLLTAALGNYVANQPSPILVCCRPKATAATTRSPILRARSPLRPPCEARCRLPDVG